MQGGPSPPVCVVSASGIISKISNIFFRFALFVLKCVSGFTYLLSAFQQFFFPLLFELFSPILSQLCLHFQNQNACCLIHLQKQKNLLNYVLGACVWPKVVAAVTRDNPGWLNSYLQLFTGTFQHSYTIYSLFIAPKRKQDLKSCLSKGTFSCVLCVSARSLSAATANMKFPSLIQLDGWQ